MSFRKTGARLASSLSTWGLKTLAHRPAANMPGKIALKIDPDIISEEMSKIAEGSIVVVGTNGKTTVTNMIADVIEASGKTVACNRTGANMAYGVAATLLQTEPTDWGVFESDELWLARILPQVKATYVVLLNLFRDQLDRCGEIDRVQDAIISGLEHSPESTLIYNADDPLCAIIAEKVENKTLAFGVSEDMHLAQNTVADAQMCQRCSGMFTYDYRQYGQLGTYHCENCGFARPKLDVHAHNVTFDGGITYAITDTIDSTQATMRLAQSGPYMVYNTLAVWTCAHKLDIDNETIQECVSAFDPQNGRLQHLAIEGRPLLLNLAKNPTGFNQNLKIITADPGKKVVAFFINDNEADGHDISWIWDCDFEELASQPELVVYAGGTRKNDLQLRLKYAGIQARLINSVNDMVDTALDMPADWNMYAIANYTALPAVRAALMERADSAEVATPREGKLSVTPAVMANTIPPIQQEPLRIVHLFPDLLNLYGDGGNLKVLMQRCAWRGIPAQLEQIHYGDEFDISEADIVFMGGGPDREQHLASQEILKNKEQLATYVEDDGVLLAICGGYQILGKNWLMGDEIVEGLSIIDAETKRANKGFDRLIENIALVSPIASHPVIGYENHAGRTHLGEGLEPFGQVVSTTGHGNNDTSGADGVRYKNVIGSYLHGPFLGKNPEVADWLIATALSRKFDQPVKLEVLDDTVELNANDFMAARLIK